VKIIAIEEHWNSASIRDALDRLPDGARDESVAFNAMGDNQARLEDIGQGRVEAMDTAGIDPAYDDLFATAARLHQPIFIHPQIPSNQLRDAAYRGLDPLVDLGLATFGWGWHMDAGLSALRLILRGTFDRHPDLQLVLGHWGEMLLFWMDRVDSLSGVAKHLERRVSDYIKTNIHITSSGMLQGRLLRHTLDFTSADRVLFSTDYPFHQPDASAVDQFFEAISDPAERTKIASGNAEALFRLTWPGTLVLCAVRSRFTWRQRLIASGTW
jgi:predicted TIM-barrel fold metal-dependent hydrolase